jgi:hypothetical protein
MKEVRIQDATEGDEVANDVVVNRQILVQSGTRLTTTMIASLIRRGVESVTIRLADMPVESGGSSSNGSDETQTMVLAREALQGETFNEKITENLNKAMAKIDGQFAPYSGDMVMDGLKAAAVRFWAERLKQANQEVKQRETAIRTRQQMQ